MQPADELRDAPDWAGCHHTFVPGDLAERLREYYPEVAAVDPNSPLGAVLGRLSAVLDTADTCRQLPNAFKDDLIGLVPRLRRYALSLTFDGNEADDLVQFTLLKAWEHRGRFEPGTSLVAWLFTILRNGFINGRRKRSREVPDPDGAHAAHLSEPPRQDHSLRLRDLQAAIGRLEPAHREALMLVAVDGLPYEAAASVIGCPSGTVKSRVSRARERLTQELGA
ncbi:sigma-70 family RNA polymerase sigma factor [Methylobacterium sp. E-065]|uniref:sigma-70 family RNA polymerase sigma factor n=1 Tax=Methylobacterium sp. E-065 TaxID=2836583 RepID=UPI001FB9A26A|nr:sigma-70 family RNA polymerase sigma factor [Methylobacterium sp. E-065]MCJ2021516.1 sigma-70 family RNA polymerase sigma factor [Methylobacterium sp. E-065]